MSLVWGFFEAWHRIPGCDRTTKDLGGNDPIGLDVRWQVSFRRRVGKQGGTKEALNPFLHRWPPHAGIGEQKVFAGDAAFRPWGAKEKCVQVVSHASEANGFINPEAEHVDPRREAVDDIDCGHIHNAALLPECESDDFGLRKLAGSQRGHIAPNGQDEAILTPFPCQLTNASCCQNEVADGIGLEDEDAQELHRISGRGGRSTLASPICVEEFSTRFVRALIRVCAEKVALGLE